MTTVDNEPFIKKSDVALMSGGFSETWVHDHATGRKLPILPSYRLGNRLRFKRSEVLAFLADYAKKLPTTKD